MGPIQASLRHLVRSQPESEAEQKDRAKDLLANCGDGVRALRHLSESSGVLQVGTDCTYEDIYRQLLALFTPGAQASEVLLVGVYHDPEAILRDDSLEVEPHLVNTRYQYFVCDGVTGVQTFALVHEDRRMLRLLGISPTFSYYLEPIVGGRVFDDHLRMLEIEKLPQLRLVRLREPLEW